MDKMTFSVQIKEELLQKTIETRHCNIAQILAILHSAGTVGTQEGLKIQTENAFVVKKAYSLLASVFNIYAEVSIRKNMKRRGGWVYSLMMPHYEDTARILTTTGALPSEYPVWFFEKSVPPLLVNSSCCKRAYLRGAFLACGSLSDPERAYHAEFVTPYPDIARMLADFISYFGPAAKVLMRKEHYVVYLKDSEEITDLLNIMEAHNALMDMENVRIVKDVRNDVNRRVNFEAANLNKTVGAAVGQMIDINYIQSRKGLSYLSEQLEEVAKIRLLYPEASLKEIGMMLTPTVGKSGVNHRFRKISEIAENLRGGLD